MRRRKTLISSCVGVVFAAALIVLTAVGDDAPGDEHPDLY